MPHWQDSQADRAYRSLHAVNSVNYGLEGGGPGLTQWIADMQLTQADLDSIRSSLDRELNSGWARRSMRPAGLRMVAMLVGGSLLAGVALLPSTLGKLGGLLAIGGSAYWMVNSMAQASRKVLYLSKLRAALEPAGVDQRWLQHHLDQQLALPFSERSDTLVEHLRHLLARATPVVQLEYQVCDFMIRLHHNPPITSDWGW